MALLIYSASVSGLRTTAIPRGALGSAVLPGQLLLHVVSNVLKAWLLLALED